MSEEDLKGKTSGFILTREFLLREDRRMQQKKDGVLTLNNRNIFLGPQYLSKSNKNEGQSKKAIGDYKLRDQMDQTSSGKSFSQIWAMFQQPFTVGKIYSFDKYSFVVVNNEVEDLLMKERISYIMDLYDRSRVLKENKLLRLINVLFRQYYDTRCYLMYKQAAILIIEREEMMMENIDQVNEQDEEEAEEINWIESFHQGRNILRIMARDLKMYAWIVKDIIDALLTLLQPHIYSFIFQRNDLDEDLINSSVLYVLECTKRPEVYNAVKKSFFEPLLNNLHDMFSFTMSDDFHDIKKKSFQRLYLPIFMHCDSELMTAVLENHALMSKMHLTTKKLLLFLIVNPLRQCDQKTQEALLMRLVPYLQGFEQWNQIMQGDDNETKMTIEKLGIRAGKIGMNLRSLINGVARRDVVTYLLIHKKFEAAFALAEIQEGLTPQQTLVMIANGDSLDESDIINKIKEANIDLDGYPQLCIWALINLSEKVFKVLWSLFGSQMVEKQIEFEENQDQALPQRSLLHDLMHQGYYNKIYMLLDLIQENLAIRLKVMRIPWNETNYDENDKILPFYLALTKQQYSLCKLLLPDSFDQVTRQEHLLLRDFITTTRISHLNKMDKESHDVLRSVDDLIEQRLDGYYKYECSFQIAKKILLLPQILKFVHALPEQNYSVASEIPNNDEENQEDQLLSINLKSVMASLAKKELGLIPELDVLVYKCGLTIDPYNLLFKLKSNERKYLFVLEHGYDLAHYFRRTRENNILIKPHSIFFEDDKVLSEQTLQSLMNNDFREVIRSLQDLIREQQEEDLNMMFGKHFDTFLTQGVPEFYVGYYLLTVQQEIKVLQDLSYQQFQLFIWCSNFGSLSHKIIFADKVKKLYPENNIFEIMMNKLDDQSLFTVSYKGEEKNLPMPFGATNLAFMMHLLNIYSIDKIIKLKQEGNPSVEQVLIDMLEQANKTMANTEEEKKDFCLMIGKVKMLHKAIEIYGQMADEIKSLAEKLNHQLSPYLLLPQHLTEENLKSVLNKITNFDKVTYIDNFEMKFELPLKFSQHHQGPYSDISAVTRFIAFQLDQFVFELTPLVYHTWLVDFEFTETQATEIRQVQRQSVYWRVNVNDLTDPDKMQVQKEEVGFIINKELIKFYLERQKPYLKRRYSVREEVKIEANEFIEELTQEQSKAVAMHSVTELNEPSVKKSSYMRDL